MYRTTCKCGGDLYLIRCKVQTRIPIAADGFSFTDASFVNTEDEVVECNRCKTLSWLEEVKEGA